jgi:signal transduction histidine kinase
MSLIHNAEGTDFAFKDMMNSVLESLPSGLIILDANETLIKINRRASEMLGLDATTHYGRLEELPPAMAPLVQLLQTTQEDQMRAELVLVLPTRPEEESTLGYTLKTVVVDDGTAFKVFIFTDITTILKDRLAMDHIKEELFQSKKMASVGTMITGVVHEINNPLTGISMSTELTRLSLERLHQQISEIHASGTPLDATMILNALNQAMTEVGKVDAASKKLAALVSDLLNYSRPAQLSLTPYPLAKLLEECISAVKTHPEFKAVTFSYRLCSPEVQVLSDRVKLEQVFYNLFKNACDAMSGKGTLEISMQDIPAAGDTKRRLCVSVKDTGVGMSEAIIKRIFEPFFTTKGTSGVGLGLSLSFRTIEQHGGEMVVKSIEGQGTTFQVFLPVFEEEEGQYPL